MSQRGNINFDQTRTSSRQGNGVQFQMFGGDQGSPPVAPASGNVAVYDSGGNVIDGGVVAGGGGVNAQTSSYALTSADKTKLVTFNGTSLTATLPSPPPSTSWWCAIENLSASALTVSRNGLTINGGSTNITLNQYDVIFVWTDGTNYFASTPLVAGTNITLTPGSAGKTIAASGGGGGGSTQHVPIPLAIVDTGTARGVINCSAVSNLHTSGGGTTDNIGVVRFSASDQTWWPYVIPSTWDGNAPTINMIVITSTNGTGNFSFTPASAPAASGADLTTLTYTSGTTVTTAAPGGSGSGFYAETVTLTVPITNLVAGKLVIIRIHRGSSDTYSATVYGVAAELVINY